MLKSTEQVIASLFPKIDNIKQAEKNIHYGSYFPNFKFSQGAIFEVIFKIFYIC